jgi:hypothetical protein
MATKETAQVSVFESHVSFLQVAALFLAMLAGSLAPAATERKQLTVLAAAARVTTSWQGLCSMVLFWAAGHGFFSPTSVSHIALMGSGAVMCSLCLGVCARGRV